MILHLQEKRLQSVQLAQRPPAGLHLPTWAGAEPNPPTPANTPSASVNGHKIEPNSGYRGVRQAAGAGLTRCGARTMQSFKARLSFISEGTEAARLSIIISHTYTHTRALCSVSLLAYACSPITARGRGRGRRPR